MNIRITSSTDQIERLYRIFASNDVEAKMYDNRGTTKTKRLYINMDDREADTIINKIEALSSGNQLPQSKR